MATITDLRIDRRKAWQRMRDMLDLADKEKRKLTGSEEETYRKLEAEVDAKAELINAAEADRDARLEKVLGAADRRGALDNMSREFEERQSRRVDWGSAAVEGAAFLDEDGREVRMSAPGQRLPGAESDVSVGRLIRSMIDTKYRKDLTREERDLLVAGVGSSGGLLLPSPVSNQVLAAAREATVIGRTADWVAMPSGKLTMAGVDSDPTATFKGENEALAEGDISFRAIELTAEKVGTYLRLSKKLARSSNAVQLVEDALKFAVARAVDYSALYGAAGVDITGVANTAGITSTDRGSIAISMDSLIDLYGDLLAENPPDPNYLVVYNSDLAQAMWKLKDGEGQYLLGVQGGTPGCYKYWNQRVSNIVPTTSTLTDVWLVPEAGRGLIIGYLSEAEIMVSEHASNGTNHAFTADEVWIRIVAYLDIACSRPAWFGRLRNVLVS